MIHYFTKHPNAANLLMIMLVALGISALPSLKRETFPDFTQNEVQITVIYPGASAEEVEDAICRRIEDAIDGVAFVEEVNSVAQESRALVTVEMEEGANFQAFLTDIKTQVEGVDDFPDNSEKPIIETVGDTQAVVSIAVAGDMTPPELKAYAERLKDQLQQNPEIALVAIQGFSEHQLRIQASAARLRELGLSPSDLADIVSGQSLDLPSGSLETDAQTLTIKLSEERRNPEEFLDLVIAGGPGQAEVRLGDVATIEDRFELDEAKIIFNGRRAAMLRVDKTDNQDALTVYQEVAAFVENEQTPTGVSLTLTRDLTSITQDRLSMLLKNAWQGLTLVFLTLWLFFNVRLAFWVAMGLPVSFLGAFFLMPYLGMSINMITMVGLLLALGLLMDDAIVIAENVATHVMRGEDVVRSVADGVSEVKSGVFSSFLTTIAVFGPITTLTGNIGQILRVMPVVLIAVLTVSLIEAFLILPNHLSHAMGHHKDKDSRFRRRFDGGLDYVRTKWLGRTVEYAVTHKHLVVGATLMVLILSMATLAGGMLKFQAFPAIDGNVVEARILMPEGTPLAQTEAVVADVVAAAEQLNVDMPQPKDQPLVHNINVQFNTNAGVGVQGTHVATVTLDLLNADRRNVTMDELRTAWRTAVGIKPDVVSLVYTEPGLGPTGDPVEIRFYGEDLNELKRASQSLQQWLSQFDGVQDIQDDLNPGKPELRINMSEGALGLGVTAADVAQQLRGAYLGLTAREIQVGVESYEVDVRLDESDRDSFADLSQFHVTMPNGRQAPLEAVAEVSEAERGWGRIARIDGRRTVTVRADVDSERANVRELIVLFESEFTPQLQETFPNVDVTVEGETAESQKTIGSLISGFAIGLLGVFILLSFQFRSYHEPLLVMAAIPLSLIGVIWGHILLGYPLTMPSMVGFVSLMGVVVNDSILLVTFIRQRVAAGDHLYDAVRGASKDRFRAVLLTSLTTVAGLLPLLAERSTQAQIMIPLAISLIFGMLASTVLILIIIPTLYAFFLKTEDLHPG